MVPLWNDKMYFDSRALPGTFRFHAECFGLKDQHSYP